MLDEHGFERLERVVTEVQAEAARRELFQPGEAGTRCLLDRAIVQQMPEMVNWEPHSRSLVMSRSRSKAPSNGHDCGWLEVGD